MIITSDDIMRAKAELDDALIFMEDANWKLKNANDRAYASETTARVHRDAAAACAETLRLKKMDVEQARKKLARYLEGRAGQ